MNELEREVWQIISDMNRAWAVDANTDACNDLFHANMVAITATDRERLIGKDACVVAWKEFVDNFETHYFREIDPQVQIYAGGSCAIVSYYFEVSYSAGGKTFVSKGRDMFVLAKENGKWWIVADHFSPYPRAVA